MRHPLLALPLCIPQTKRARSRTLQQNRTSQPNQNVPARQPPTPKIKRILQIESAVAVQERSGRVREAWRVGRTLRKGLPCASKVFLSLLHLPVPQRADTVRATENAGEVLRVGEAATVGNLAKRHVGAKKHFLCLSKPACIQILQNRDAVFPPEMPRQRYRAAVKPNA